MSNAREGDVIYRNSLSSGGEVRGWVMEGRGKISFPEGRLHMENELDPERYGDDAHFVYWCPETFPDKIMIQWDFYPVREPGLCMIFFAACGLHGEDLFDPRLAKRSGRYPEYHSGDINALHLSYFRHKHDNERAFRTCNLRKSRGFHLVKEGADPLPPADDAMPPYRMKLIKDRAYVHFSINGLSILEWKDDGRRFGPVYGGGKIGFRQMAPLVAAYANLEVRRLV
ncbi:YesU family protein [Bacillus glycinifermentans]|uniref:YesU family protein n=1 Tax=Bacillus glycinifermentans TaxID=1664069 RepID=UPI001FF2A697|nr:YesU family protein [Bacillus glycinifermentans]UOY88695.1 YesU family protein [Bacillus glycinifermentans]